MKVGDLIKNKTRYVGQKFLVIDIKTEKTISSCPTALTNVASTREKAENQQKVAKHPKKPTGTPFFHIESNFSIFCLPSVPTIYVPKITD